MSFHILLGVIHYASRRPFEWKLLIGWLEKFYHQKLVLRANIQNKMDHTMRPHMKYCTRKSCQKFYVSPLVLSERYVGLLSLLTTSYFVTSYCGTFLDNFGRLNTFKCSYLKFSTSNSERKLVFLLLYPRPRCTSVAEGISKTAVLLVMPSRRERKLTRGDLCSFLFFFYQFALLLLREQAAAAVYRKNRNLHFNCYSVP